MAVIEIIKEDRHPLTKEDLVKDLLNLGLKKGDYVLVHSSLKQVGYIIGGAETVIDALIEVVTEEGLIVMPCHTPDNSNPEIWKNPPVPTSWVKPLKEHMPAFKKELTPTRGVGAIPELFRKYPGVIRSNHPQVSFVSYGKKSEILLKDHPYDDQLSDISPLGLMYQWGFKILMIGTDYNTCTAMHLSEYRANCRGEVVRESAVLIGNKREWIQYKDIDIDSDDFNKIGLSYEKSHEVIKRNVGYAKTRLLDLKSLIDYATEYLGK